MSRLNAQGEWLVVRRTAAEKTDSGIILASEVKKIERGEVVTGSHSGPGKGDTVIYRNGQEFEHDGAKLYAVERKDVIAIVGATQP